MKVQTSILSNLREQERLDEYTKWKRIAGPKYKNMDETYELDIMTKLVPMLNKYGIKMVQHPLVDKPGKQTYVGFDNDGNKIRFNFYNQHEDKLDNREGKYDMLVTIDYEGETVEAGVVDLKSKDGVENAFSLITMTLEDLGVNINNNAKEVNQETNTELDDLANFKASLSEQELLELDK